MVRYIIDAIESAHIVSLGQICVLNESITGYMLVFLLHKQGHSLILTQV